MLSTVGGGDDAARDTPRWQLPPGLQLHILSFLPPNDRALSGRLVSPDAAAALTGPDTPPPCPSRCRPTPHPGPWMRHSCIFGRCPSGTKLQLLCTAAATIGTGTSSG